MKKGVLFLGIPLLLAWIGVLERSVPLLICALVSHFLVLKAVPLFRGREGLWMFVLVTLTSVPVNLAVLYLIDRMGILRDMWLFRAAYGVLIYMILLSAEELCMGVAARLLWRKQRSVWPKMNWEEI